MSPTTRSRKRARTDSSTGDEEPHVQQILSASAPPRTSDHCSSTSDKDAIQVDDADDAGVNVSAGTGGKDTPIERLCFADGNVVIRASDWVFRVHRSLLERESKVFEKKLLPKARRIAEGDYAGCLEVCLSEEYKYEVIGFLDAIYEAKILYNRRNYVRAAGEAFGMLRLGTDYDAPSVRLEALERFIESEWAIMGKCPELDGDNDDAHEIIWRPTDAIILANLAFKSKIYRLLPLALYACCQLDGDDLIDGCSRMGYDEELDPELMKKVLVARRHLVLHAHSILRSVPRDGNPDCKNLEPPAVKLDRHGRPRPEVLGPSRCWKGTRVNSVPATKLRPITAAWHPVLKLNAWKAHCMEQPLCSDCVSWVEMLFEDAKEVFLKALPVMLDIQDLMEEPGKE